MFYYIGKAKLINVCDVEDKFKTMGFSDKMKMIPGNDDPNWDQKYEQFLESRVKKTKQGVRDLNHIKAKSVGIKLEFPPENEVDSEALRKQKVALRELNFNREDFPFPSKKDFDRY